MDRPVGTVLVVLFVVLASISVVASDGPGVDESVAPAGGSATGAVAGANESNGTVRRLSVDGGSVVSGFATVDPELGAATSFGDAEFRGQMLGYTAVQRLSEAENESVARRVIRDSLDDAQASVENLRDAESTAIRAYHAGEIGTDELLRRLGRIDARAGSLRRSVSYLRSKGRDASAFSFQLRTRSLWIIQDIGTFEGRIRDEIERAFRGETDDVRVHVVASDDGFALEMIEDGIYVRDAVRFDNYKPNEAPTVGIDDVFQLAYERYPSLKLNPEDPRHRGPIDRIGQRLWRLGLQYPQGNSTVYFDRTTGKAYREVHRLELQGLPTRTVGQTVENGLRVTVNGTDQGNPYRIEVVDGTTGAPVDATVSVDGTVVGTTGGDGTLWALGGRGGFTVTVDTGSRSVDVDVPAR